MAFTSDGKKWAEETFGLCELGDPRRVRRLIDFSARLSENPSGSISKVCGGDEAAQEGAYKLIENDAVRPDDIGDGVFASTAAHVGECEVCLAIQDTTAVSFSHSIAEGLKESGSPTGYLVHSTLMVDASSREPLGLLDQERWIREEKSKRHNADTRKVRSYENKESFRWALASNRVERRLKSMSNVVTVCDREADIFEFLQFQTSRSHQFVVRAAQDRRLETADGRLWSRVSEQPVLGTRRVTIAQRGAQRESITQRARPARKGRVATVEIRAARVALRPPKNRKVEGATTIEVNAVYVSEVAPSEDTDGVSWMLLTTEPVSTFEQADTVVDYYSCRWLIEEFHKAWKSGCKVEERKLQALENLERMMVITAAVAVRILQLKALAEDGDEETDCGRFMTTEEWQCLHAVISTGKPLPEKPPQASWAYYGLAKLAGWTDSKRTGRVGWQTLWEGWETLQNHLIGWRAARAAR